VASDPYAWSWNAEALVAIPAISLAYLLALRRYPANAWRTFCFASAVVLLLAVTITPLETIALEYLLSIHLLQNVVLAEWAPALVVLAIPPALAATLPRWLRRRRDGVGALEPASSTPSPAEARRLDEELARFEG